MHSPRNLVIALAALAALAACGPDTNIGPVAVTLAVSPDSLAMVLTDPPQRLVAVGTDDKGISFAVSNATWSSDSPGSAAVDTTGLVTAVAPGTATITARAGGRQASAAVSVTPAPAFATSTDSVAFSAIANGPTPASQNVAIANGGGGTLSPATLSVAYGPSASGWLQPTLTGPSAPDTLQLAITTTALSFGTYAATVTLHAPKAVDHAVKVTLTLGPGAPAQLVRVIGDSQAAIVNTAVPNAPVVRVIDAFGNVVPGTPVQFAVTAGGGSLGKPADTTRASGTASPGSWTLGASAGTNHFTATVSGLPVVQFTAFGNPGNAVNLLKISGDGQSDTAGATLGTLLTVRVTDGSGNGVPGVTVAWSVGTAGSITPTAPQTDANGFSSASRTLGTITGVDSALASVGGLVGSPVLFLATVHAGRPATIAAYAGDGQYATVDSNVAVAPAVIVQDGFGNGVSGVAISFAVAANNGTIGGLTPTTNGGGIATLGFWTMSAARRIDTLTATPTSITLSGSPVRFTAHAAWSLRDQVQPQVFSAICAACHTQGGQFPHLQTDSAAYQSLLNGNGTMTIYVTPFDTTDDGFTKTHGYLLFRLKSTTAPMPPGAGGPLATTNPSFYAIIRDWILDGARR